MATKNVDPRRDIWGALIGESEETQTALGANDASFLFIGGCRSGKTTLQNAFFSRLEEPKPTLIWNSCTDFEPAQFNSMIDEMVNEQNPQV